MSEWLFITGVGVVLTISLFLALYPLRRSRFVVMLFAPIWVLCMALGYLHWGAGPEFRHFLVDNERRAQVKAILNAVNGPDALIAQLKERVNANPSSAKGWFLLGRLYMGQGAWNNARESFEKARQLDPNDEATRVNLVLSYWQGNHQVVNKKIHGLLMGLLQNDANQPDALAILALDAFQQKHYSLAINYWQQLLALTPPQSEDASAIRRAIAKAQSDSKNHETSHNINGIMPAQ